MGTYYSSYVDVDASPELVKSIVSKGRNKDSSWDSFCFRKWSDEAKWTPDELVVYLSKTFPTVVFYLGMISSYGLEEFYCLEGELVNKKAIYGFPQFPKTEQVLNIIEVMRKRRSDSEKLKNEQLKQAKIEQLKKELEALQS